MLGEDLDRLLRQPRDGEDLLDAVELSGATVRSLSESVTLTNGGTDNERYAARNLINAASKASADTARRVSAGRQARHAGKLRRWNPALRLPAGPGRPREVRTKYR